MRVVALQTWSNGTITMEEKSVQEIPDALAEQLIADGIVARAAIPTMTRDDAGKVLVVDENGNVVPQYQIKETLQVTFNVDRDEVTIRGNTVTYDEIIEYLNSGIILLAALINNSIAYSAGYLRYQHVDMHDELFAAETGVRRNTINGTNKWYAYSATVLLQNNQTEFSYLLVENELQTV